MNPIPRASSSLSITHTPWRASAVKMAPLSDSTLAGYPCPAAAWWKVVTTSTALVTRLATDATHSREWSSIRFKISTSEPVASTTWVTSICQHSLGSSAQKRTQEIFGRLWG